MENLLIEASSFEGWSVLDGPLINGACVITGDIAEVAAVPRAAKEGPDLGWQFWGGEEADTPQKAEGSSPSEGGSEPSAPARRRGKRGRSRKPVWAAWLTLPVMAAKAHLPIHVAAAELGMGTTMASAPSSPKASERNAKTNLDLFCPPPPATVEGTTPRAGLESVAASSGVLPSGHLGPAETEAGRGSLPGPPRVGARAGQATGERALARARCQIRTLTALFLFQASVGSEQFLDVLDRSRAVLKSAQKWYHKNMYAGKKNKVI